MKKTLLSVLLLVASAIMAQAQGFRVIKSDGTVYQFSWVADRIEFYEGDGDPNWVEPIPDEVKDAIATLQSACATNAARIDQIQAALNENKAAVMNVVKDLADINEQLSDRINALALHVTENTAKIERNTTNIDRNTADIATIGEKVGWCQYTVGEHDEAIKDHQETIESLLNQCRTLNDKITTVEDVIASLEQIINQDFNTIQKQIDELNNSLFATIESQQEQFQSLKLENQNQQAMIEELSVRISQLEHLINQLRNQ